MTRFWRCQAQRCLATLAKPLLTAVATLPTDALIDLEVRGRLGRFIPVWGWLHALCGLRVALVPQWRPACRGDVRRLRLHPDVLQYLADIGTVCDEGDDVHLPAADGAQQREHLVDTGHQHRPQIVRRALGWHRLGGLGLGWQWASYPKCALACSRAGWLGLHLRRFHRCITRQRRDGRPQG